jgi:hypothetical protein
MNPHKKYMATHALTMRYETGMQKIKSKRMNGRYKNSRQTRSIDKGDKKAFKIHEST